MTKPYVASRDGTRRGDEVKWIGQAIPMDQWGKDHWSTLLYIETRVVDHRGVVDPRHMRLDGRKHPTRLADGTPLLFKKGRQLVGHNDYDCAEDMEHIGLLKNNGTGVNPVYELTDFGWKLAHALRRWRAAGKNTASFRHEEYL